MKHLGDLLFPFVVTLVSDQIPFDPPSAFINAARIYIRMKMTEETATTQVAWVLSYVQGGVAEMWKDNLMDELAKGELEVKTVEQLFSKIRNDFGETSEEERKIEQL